MVKQPSARTITEAQAAELSELRASMMPEVNLGKIGGRIVVRPRLSGRSIVCSRLAGNVTCDRRLGGSVRMT